MSGKTPYVRTEHDKLTEMVSVKDARFGARGDGVTDDSLAIRAAIAAAPAGGTLYFPSGTYLVSQDGANVWCVAFTKAVSVVADHGVTIKSNTNGARTVLRFSAAVVSSAALVVDCNSKSNFGVEVDSAGGGTHLTNWESKNASQQYLTAYQAGCFRVAAAVGVTFENCYAHDAVSTPNGVQGDNYGAARGFLFDGTAATYGVNTVRGCRVDRIYNTSGLAGDYEDEDGIVTQMNNSFTVIESNFVTNCSKRGIKLQNPARVVGNTIISSRTLGNAAGGSDGTKRMYGGISLYADNSKVEKNLIASLSVLDNATGGAFGYGVEVGAPATAYYRNAVNDNVMLMGTLSNARAMEFISLKGAQVGFEARGNRISVDASLTLNQTYGIRVESDHATLYTSFNIEQNDLANLVYAMLLHGGICGSVCGNKIRGLSGAWGIAVDTAAYALNPTSLLIAENQGIGMGAQYTVRVNEVNTTGLVLAANTTDSAGTAACFVAAGVRYSESASGGFQRPVTIYGSAPPTTGTWNQGDICKALIPSYNAPVSEWRCRTAGTPGTWVATSWLVVGGAVRPTGLTSHDEGVMFFDTALNANGKPIFYVSPYWVDATGAVV